MTDHVIHHDPAVVAIVEREVRRALTEAADFIEATSGIGRRDNDYADGWYDALGLTLSEIRDRIPPP